ncbi:MAG: hypothetical protein II497_00985, partial [Lachnospiraceae bacterium]|nr:hypothetical protein [Lachnospiraceae bacterium]
MVPEFLLPPPPVPLLLPLEDELLELLDELLLLLDELLELDDEDELELDDELVLSTGILKVYVY